MTNQCQHFNQLQSHAPNKIEMKNMYPEKKLLPEKSKYKNLHISVFCLILEANKTHVLTKQGSLKRITHNEKVNINEHIIVEARKVCFQKASRLFYKINQGRTSQRN